MKGKLTVTSNRKGLVEVPGSTHGVKVEPPKRKRKRFPFTGFIDFQGILIDVENKKGSVRRGEAPDGTPWETHMHAHYGEIRNTKGTDKDALDVYVGPNHDSSLVVVIHQNDPESGAYDEDKVMIGFDSEEEAIGAYKKQYDRPGFYGEHTSMPIGAFWRWVNGESAKSGRKVTMSKGHSDKMKGGLADDAKPGDFDKRALYQGMKVEMEHTDDDEVAREIAMDHLTEDPDYYTKLAKMEGEDEMEKSASIPASVKRKVKDLLIKYKGKPVPDSKVHAIADVSGVDTDELESYIYGLASEHLMEKGCVDELEKSGKQVIKIGTRGGKIVSDKGGKKQYQGKDKPAAAKAKKPEHSAKPPARSVEAIRSDIAWGEGQLQKLLRYPGGSAGDPGGYNGKRNVERMIAKAKAELVALGVPLDAPVKASPYQAPKGDLVTEGGTYGGKKTGLTAAQINRAKGILPPGSFETEGSVTWSRRGKEGKSEAYRLSMRLHEAGFESTGTSANGTSVWEDAAGNKVKRFESPSGSLKSALFEAKYIPAKGSVEPKVVAVGGSVAPSAVAKKVMPKGARLGGGGKYTWSGEAGRGQNAYDKAIDRAKAAGFEFKGQEKPSGSADGNFVGGSELMVAPNGDTLTIRSNWGVVKADNSFSITYQQSGTAPAVTKAPVKAPVKAEAPKASGGDPKVQKRLDRANAKLKTATGDDKAKWERRKALYESQLGGEAPAAAKAPTPGKVTVKAAKSEAAPTPGSGAHLEQAKKLTRRIARAKRKGNTGAAERYQKQYDELVGGGGSTKEPKTKKEPDPAGHTIVHDREDGTHTLTVDGASYPMYRDDGSAGTGTRGSWFINEEGKHFSDHKYIGENKQEAITGRRVERRRRRRLQGEG